ncbi:MAG: hypothetical protein GY906_12995 [bacterium]|nr:hypothetical protein [bacterium]
MLVQSGLSFEFVIDQDIYSFNALVAAHFRVLARDRIEAAQTSQLSSQASGKDLQKWLKKRWFPFLSHKGQKQSDNDAEAFLQKFSEGI